MTPTLAAARTNSAGILHALMGAATTRRFLADDYRNNIVRGDFDAALLNGFGARNIIGLCASQCELALLRDGSQVEADRPTDEALIAARLTQGCSLVFRGVDQHDVDAGMFGRKLAAELGGQLNLSVHLTPAGHGSVGWHFDAEEVFIFQVSGRERYDVRANTVLPAPMRELTALPSVEQEVTAADSVELGTNEWLYIPAGYWHRANALTQALSVSVGVLAPSPLDVLTTVRASLARDPRWRTRLDSFGTASDLSDTDRLQIIQDTFAALSLELDAMSRSPAAALRFLAAWSAPRR